MKVVLFCGGQGLRLRDFSPNTPKPLVAIGSRPIIWHLMNYYAHYGHREFILCLGYKADALKDYFLNYQETLSNDFVLRRGGSEIELLNQDIEDWTIRFVDTGLKASIGERLLAVRDHLGSDERFLANYADGLSDIDLNAMIAEFEGHGKVASFAAVRPGAVFHMVDTEPDGTVTGVTSMQDADLRMNGGFFVFRKEIFDYINQGEDLLDAPFRRLVEARQVRAFLHDGFWQCMDTFKDRQALEELASGESPPWQTWKRRG